MKALLSLSAVGACVALTTGFIALNAAVMSAHYFNLALQFRKEH